MKKILKSAMLVALTAAGFTACSDEYDPGVYTPGDKQREEFAKNFEEMFGEINPEQDWTIATRGEVTVTSNTNSNVKIYAKEGKNYRIVGDFANVSGTQTLKFDIKKGITELMVSDGSSVQKAYVGGSVSLGASTRAGNYSSNPTIVMECDDDEKIEYFSRSKVLEYQNVLPEVAAGESDGLSAIKKKQLVNLNKVAQDFMYVSTGDIYFYPMFYITGNTNTIGLYYYNDSNQKIEIPVYTIKTGPEMQFGTWPAYGTVFSHDSSDEHNAPDYTYDCTPYEQFIPAVWEEGVMKTPASLKTMTWKNVDRFEIDYNIVDFEYLRVCPIKIHLEPGTQFGMYVDTGSKKFYSQSELNTDKSYDFTYEDGPDSNGKTTNNNGVNHVTGATLSSRNASHVATFEYGGETYIGFEDWDNTHCNSDMDLNDCMVLLRGAKPIIVEENPDEWVVACEDLGDTHDIDFNDVVFKVSHVSGREYAYFTPLAAAGTLESHVYYNTTDLGEIHQLLGGSAPDIINGETQTNYGSSVQLTVDANFTMAHVGDPTQNLGGFSIITSGSGSTSSADGKITITSKNTKGKAPQIIVLPAKYNRHVSSYTETGDWGWPKEGVYIGNAYNVENHSFTDWVTNNVTDWYNNFDDAEVVKNGTVEQVLDNDPIDPDPEEGGDTSVSNVKKTLTSSDWTASGESGSGVVNWNDVAYSISFSSIEEFKELSKDDFSAIKLSVTAQKSGSDELLFDLYDLNNGYKNNGSAGSLVREISSTGNQELFNSIWSTGGLVIDLFYGTMDSVEIEFIR